MDIPPLACDCHMHVFGPRARYPLAAKRSYTPAEAPIERYLAWARPLGLARVVLVQASVYGTDNRAMLDTMARLGESCRGVAVVDPAISAVELAALHRAGVRGLRVNLLSYGSYAEADARATIAGLAARIAPHGWHLQIFVAPTLLIALAPLLVALPVPVVVDHMSLPGARAGLGQPGFATLLELLASGNVWVKLAGADRISKSNAAFAAARPFASALVAARPDRLVWGSDWPHIGWHTPNATGHDEVLPFRDLDEAKLLGQLGEWSGDAAVRRGILSDNPAKLYGF